MQCIVKLLLTVGFIGFAFQCSSQHFADDTISSYTVWEADSVVLEHDVLIDSFVTLVIKPGVKVVSEGYYKIEVRGNIKAKGTENSPILFTVRDTIGFMDTTTTSGGWNGIEFDHTSAQNESSIFTHCIFEYGKAIGSTIKNGQGGALYVNNFDKIRIENTVFRNNIAAFRGGAVFLGGNSNVIISNCFFKGNSCGVLGGALCIFENSAPKVNQNIFIQNISYSVFSSGGSLFARGEGGGIAIQNNSNDTFFITNNIISNNSSFGSAGLYESSKYAHIISNIIVNNYSSVSTLFCGSQVSEAQYVNNTIVNNRGIGIEYISSYLRINNNIIRNNYDPLTSDMIGNLQAFMLLEGEPEISYNNIGMESKGQNNIDSPTQFVNPTQKVGLEEDGLSADWRLEKSSPEIDAGTVMGIEMDLPSTDVYGNPRITGENIDMGAAEYDFSSDIDVPRSDEYVTVYPNPFSGQLWIELDKQFLREVHVQVVNANGRIIANRECHTDIMEFQSQSWPSGPYFLNILSEEGKLLHSAKVIKQ